MNNTITIIDELEQMERGQKVANPEQVARALETKAMQIQVEETLTQMRVQERGDIKDMIQEVASETRVRSAREPAMTTKDVVRELTDEARGQKVADPERLVDSLLEKAKRIREECRSAIGQGAGNPANQGKSTGTGTNNTLRQEQEAVGATGQNIEVISEGVESDAAADSSPPGGTSGE